MVLLTKDDTWCTSLCHTLDTMRQSNGFSDVVIRAAGGHILRAHSCVLACASSVLKTRLLSSPHYLHIPDVSKGTWEVLLHFIYSGNLEINASDMKGVFETGTLLELVGLTALCEDWLTDSKQDVSGVTEGEEDVDGSQAHGNHTASEDNPNVSATDESGSRILDILVENQPDACAETAYSQIEELPDTPRPLDAREITLNAKTETAVTDKDRVDLPPFGTDDELAPEDESVHESSGDDSWGDFPTRAKLKRKNPTKVFSCGECKKSYRKRTSLLDHMNYHTGEKPYKCSVCGLAFACRSNCVRHGKTHLDEKPHVCLVCDKSFRRPSTMARHQRCMHGGRESHVCPTCGKGFATPGAVAKHERTHMVDRPFMCDICDNTFTTMASLLTHRRSHTEEQPHSCEICEETFPDQAELDRHMQTHPDDKPHKCCTCDKAFQRKDDLVVHECKHTGVKPFMCYVCGKEFGFLSNLAKHRQLHKEEKNHECAICSKRFARRCSLAAHARVHIEDRPFVCTLCNKSFKEEPNLRRHKHLHLGEKNFACPVCGKAFNRRADMQRHERNKHGEKRYKCMRCERSYVSQSALEKHRCLKKYGDTVEAFLAW